MSGIFPKILRPKSYFCSFCHLCVTGECLLAALFAMTSLTSAVSFSSAVCRLLVVHLTCHCFCSGEGESGAEVPEEEGGQPEQACAALSGPAHPSVRTIPKPLWQIRIESMHHIIVMIHCSPESKCALKALRPLNHHVCLSVCMLFKEVSETDREWMSLFAYNSAAIKVSCVFSVCRKE